MAILIPPEAGHPTIKIFDSLHELHAETGQKVCHGFFDARSNTIMATADSVAHEIGHYLDVKSGQFKNPNKISNPIHKTEACLRNEIVAILFAYAKCGDGGASLSHEAKFLDWLKFNRKTKKFGPHSTKKLQDLSFPEIQELADWMVHSKHEWIERLTVFFRSYLVDEGHIVTYGQKSIRVGSILTGFEKTSK